MQKGSPPGEGETAIKPEYSVQGMTKKRRYPLRYAFVRSFVRSFVAIVYGEHKFVKSLCVNFL